MDEDGGVDHDRHYCGSLSSRLPRRSQRTYALVSPMSERSLLTPSNARIASFRCAALPT